MVQILTRDVGFHVLAFTSLSGATALQLLHSCIKTAPFDCRLLASHLSPPSPAFNVCAFSSTVFNDLVAHTAIADSLQLNSQPEQARPTMVTHVISEHGSEADRSYCESHEHVSCYSSNLSSVLSSVDKEMLQAQDFLAHAARSLNSKDRAQHTSQFYSADTSQHSRNHHDHLQLYIHDDHGIHDDTATLRNSDTHSAEMPERCYHMQQQQHSREAYRADKLLTRTLRNSQKSVVRFDSLNGGGGDGQPGKTDGRLEQEASLMLSREANDAGANGMHGRRHTAPLEQQPADLGTKAILENLRNHGKIIVNAAPSPSMHR